MTTFKGIQTHRRVVVLGEGENGHDWAIPESDAEDDNTIGLNQDFAPRGRSRFQERVRNKLPESLDLSSPRHKTAFVRFYNVCLVWPHQYIPWELRLI